MQREEKRLEAKEFVVAADVIEETVEVVCRLELALPLEAIAKEKDHEDSA